MNFPPYNIYYIYVFDLSPWLISLGLNCLYNLMSLTHHSHCITYDLFQTFILYLSFIPLLLRNITIRATLFRSYIWCGYYVCLLPCETCLRLIQRRRMPSMKSKALWICCRIHVRPEPDCLQVNFPAREWPAAWIFHDMSTRGKVRPKEGLQEEEESIIQDI